MDVRTTAVLVQAFENVKGNTNLRIIDKSSMEFEIHVNLDRAHGPVFDRSHDQSTANHRKTLKKPPNMAGPLLTVFHKRSLLRKRLHAYRISGFFKSVPVHLCCESGGGL